MMVLVMPTGREERGGYSLRAYPEMNERGDQVEGRDLVDVGVLGTEEIVSVLTK